MSYLPVGPLAWVLLAAATAAAALALRRFAYSTWLIAAGFALLGVSLAQTAWHFFPNGDIAYYSSESPSLARLRLRIVEPPRTLASSQAWSAGVQADAEVLEVQCEQGWRSAGGRVLLRVSGTDAALSLGDEVEALGTLSRIAPSMNPGEWDLRQSRRLQGMLCRFQCEPQVVQRLATRGEGLLGSARRRAREALAAGFAPRDSEQLALAKALLFGDSDPAIAEVREDFRRTGTTHHLAISGTHIAVLSLFVYGICRLLLLRPARATIVGMTFTLIYGLVVVPSPPVLRSVLLCLTLALSLLLRRRVEMVQLLCLAGGVMIAMHPLDAFDAGFQLSFLTVLGLMVLSQPLAAFLRNLESEHARVARRVSPPGGMARAWVSLREKAIVVGSAGLVAWVVSMPLIAWHFRQLNPWAVPASILLGVVVAATLVTGLIKVIVALLIPQIAGLMAPLVALLAGWMAGLAEALAAVPATEAAAAPLPVVAILLYYAALGAPLYLRHPRVWLAPALAVILMVAAPVAMAVHGSGHSGARLTCLSVGAGSCAVLESGGGVIMVDCGSSSPAACARTVRPFLRYRNIQRIDCLYLTHGDTDHVSGVLELLRHVPVRELVMYRDAARMEAIREAAAGRGIAIREVAAGDVLEHAGMSVRVLFPAGGVAVKQENDASLVLAVMAEGKRVLFTGDIGAPVRQKLAGERADLVIAPHHGSVTAGTRELIEQSGAQVVFSSDDPSLSASQRRLQAIVGAASLYRTGGRGALTAEWRDGGAIRVTCWR